jgi:hypothetical protein
MDKAWKRSERSIAKLVGGERVPITGRQRGSAPDVKHDWLSIEVKHRRKLPTWVRIALDQARASVRGEQLPVAILHEHRRPHADDWLVVRLSDFQAYFGVVTITDEEKADGESEAS